MLPCGAPGARMAPTPPGCPSFLGAFAVCRAHSRPLPCPARALRCPRAGSLGLRLPFRHRCAGEPVPRLAALPIGRGAARRSGPGGPPPPSLRPLAAAPGRLGPRLPRGGALWPPAQGCGPPAHAGGPCARVPWLTPLPRPGARAGGSPRAGLVSLAAPAGGRGGCGRGQARAFYGFAAAARPARRVSAAAGTGAQLRALDLSVFCEKRQSIAAQWVGAHLLVDRSQLYCYCWGRGKIERVYDGRG